MSRPATHIVEALAMAAADAFFEFAGERDRWRSLPEHKRATFRLMAVAAIAAAKLARSVPGADVHTSVARAASGAFFEGADCPNWLRNLFDWDKGFRRDEGREVFCHVAAAIADAGRSLRAGQAA